MCLPAAGGGAWLIERSGPGFTPAEYARAQALVAVATAAAPRPAATLLLADGRELVLRRAQAGDVDAVRALHDRCSPPALRRYYLGQPPRPSRAHLLRRLVPASGWALLAEVADGPAAGRVVALATLVGEGAQGELSLLVEDAWQRRGIGTALSRRMVAAAEEAGYAAVHAHSLAGDPALPRTLRRLGRAPYLDRDEAVVTVTVPLASEPVVSVPEPVGR